MSKFKELLSTHHIQLALATGVSIIVMAYVSKRVLVQPMNTLAQAFPPFLAFVAEGVISKFPSSKFSKTWHWVLAILLATVLVITAYLL